MANRRQIKKMLSQQSKKLDMSINKLTAYDRYTREFRDEIRIAENAPNRTSAQYLKAHRTRIMNSKLSDKQKLLRLTTLSTRNVIKVNSLYGGGKEALQHRVAMQQLIDVRESDKYRAMVDSAIERGMVSDEAEFFQMTVNSAVKSAGLNPATFIPLLNSQLEAHGLSPVEMPI